MSAESGEGNIVHILRGEPGIVRLEGRRKFMRASLGERLVSKLVRAIGLGPLRNVFFKLRQWKINKRHILPPPKVDLIKVKVAQELT